VSWRYDIPTSKRIQAFVAGALAIIGFRALVWAPHYFAARDSVYILGCLGDGLALPIGVAILVGSSRAIRLAEIYLLLEVVGLFALVVAFALHLLPPGAPNISWRSVPDLLVPLFLLSLLIRSRLLRHESDTSYEG
jgi:hypothetical protein